MRHRWISLAISACLIVIGGALLHARHVTVPGDPLSEPLLASTEGVGKTYMIVEDVWTCADANATGKQVSGALCNQNPLNTPCIRCSYQGIYSLAELGLSWEGAQSTMSFDCGTKQVGVCDFLGSCNAAPAGDCDLGITNWDIQ